MQKLIYKIDNRTQYKDQIIDLGKKYLPGVNKERLEWMDSGNPAGASYWIMAFEETSNNLVATMSIMPKNFYFKGKKLLSGILGDFIVDKKHRIWGPSFDLPIIAKTSMNDLGMKFLYTIPNNDSIKIIQRVGFINILNLNTFVKPLKIRKYIEKYLYPIKELSPIISPIIDIILKIYYGDVFIKNDNIYENILNNDINSDKWNRKNNNDILYSDKNYSYIEWRYMKNPYNKFRIFYHNQSDTLGYHVATIINNNYEIFDIVTNTNTDNDFNEIVKDSIYMARINNCDSIKIQASLPNHASKILRKHGFIAFEDRVPIYYIGDAEYMKYITQFYSGDRNI